MRTDFTTKCSCTLPHALPTTHATLLSTSAEATSAVLLKNPIASNFAYVRTEPVHFPPESHTSTPSVAAFPEIWLPGEDKPANGTRTHFTYVETVSFFFGIFKSSFPLNGWFAAPDAGTAGDNVGYVEILANPEAKRWKQVLVRKVRCLREQEGGQTVVEEELKCDLVWGIGWLSKGTALSAHKKCMGSYGELFAENKS